MFRKISGILIVLACLTMSMCGYRQNGIGASDTIYVFANEQTRKIVGSAIDTTFSFGYRTPEFIKFFKTVWKPLDSFPEVIRFKNLIVIADLNQSDLGVKIAKGILPPEKYKLAEQDSIFIFAIEDVWVDGQMVVVIAGKDLKRMSRNILEQKGWLYAKFNQTFERIEKADIYAKNEQKKMSRTFWKKYQWTMRIQHDYVVIRESELRKFVWIGRGYPYRWLSVSWENGIKTEWLTANGLFEKRQEIGKYYQEIETDKRFLGTYFTQFGKWNALRMSGLWYHTKESKGGPFVIYAFYDPETDRTFVIDIILFAPVIDSSVLLRQVEIMANTFTTKMTDDYYDDVVVRK
ncbi:MAG: DUF4837 family protein [Candidatus Neomarinimicrobiota bacterium]